MFETLKNAFSSKEIRVKIYATLALLVVYRLGCFVPLPGLDASVISGLSSEGLLGMLSAVTGGSMSQGTLFALGIIPFINAFIIMQLLTLIIPKLEKLSKEGEEGRQKVTQITRYVALGLAAIQAVGIMLNWNNNGAVKPLFSMQSNWLTIVFGIMFLIAGSVFCMWLSERITEYGISNGSSLIIFVGILSTAGTVILNSFTAMKTTPSLVWNFVGFLLLVVAIFFFIVFVDGGERRITVQYAKQVKGNKMYGGQTTHIPIRINGSGVMPIIFASSFMSFPTMLIQMFGWTGGFVTFYTKYLTPVRRQCGGQRGLLRCDDSSDCVLCVLLRANAIQSGRRVQKHSTIRRLRSGYPSGQSNRRLFKTHFQSYHPVRSNLPCSAYGCADIPVQRLGQKPRLCKRIQRNGLVDRSQRCSGTQQTA